MGHLRATLPPLRLPAPHPQVPPGWFIFIWVSPREGQTQGLRGPGLGYRVQTGSCPALGSAPPRLTPQHHGGQGAPAGATRGLLSALGWLLSFHMQAAWDIKQNDGLSLFK